VFAAHTFDIDGYQQKDRGFGNKDKLADSEVENEWVGARSTGL